MPQRSKGAKHVLHSAAPPPLSFRRSVKRSRTNTEQGGRNGLLLCLGWWGSGLRSSDVWKQLRMEHRPCTQEGGKEREGGSVELGKSEGGGGGGGGRGGSSQWKNCEMCLAKSGAVILVFFGGFFFFFRSKRNNEIQISCYYFKGFGLFFCATC